VVLYCVCTASPRCGRSPPTVQISIRSSVSTKTRFNWISLGHLQRRRRGIDPMRKFFMLRLEKRSHSCRRRQAPGCVGCHRVAKKLVRRLRLSPACGRFSNGSARSDIQTAVNANLEYHVFLTPNGDCKGLYVHQKTATSFEVRELGGGKLQREVRLSHHCSAEELREGSLSPITLASSPEAGMEEYARQRNSRRVSFRDQSTPAGPDLFALR
jgi:hypothetical protein